MTSSTKPEVRNVLHCRQSRQSHGHKCNTYRQFRVVWTCGCFRAHRQTQRHTDTYSDRNTSHDKSSKKVTSNVLEVSGKITLKQVLNLCTILSATCLGLRPMSGRSCSKYVERNSSRSRIRKIPRPWFKPVGLQIHMSPAENTQSINVTANMAVSS